MSPLPDIRQVFGQAARNDENGIDAEIVTVAGVARGETLGGDRDPFQPVPVERYAGGIVGSARLDLDKRNDAAAPGYQVNFAARDPSPASQYSPTVEAQPECRHAFGEAAAAFGLLAIHFIRSSARA